MASTKVRALIGIARILAAIGMGWGIYWMWSNQRAFDPPFVSIGAGVLAFVIVAVLLEKLKGGGD